MYEYLIKEYLKKITIKDILNYAKKNNLEISNSDASILLIYAKKHYETLLNGDPTNIFKELKQKIKPETYKEVYKLYIEYKLKYLS